MASRFVASLLAAIEGTVLIPDRDATTACCGQAATTREVIRSGEIRNSATDIPRATLKGET